MRRSLRSLRYVDEVAVGQRIKLIRKRLGFTQEELGLKLGLKQASVNRYEKGRIPEGNLLAMIADLGGVAIDWLLKGGPEPTEQDEAISEEVMEIARAFSDLSERDQGALDTSIQIIKSALDRITNYNRDSFSDMSTDEVARKLKDFMETELDALNQALCVKIGALVMIIQSKVKSLKGSELYVGGKDSIDELLAARGSGGGWGSEPGVGRFAIKPEVSREIGLINEISKDEELKPVFERFLEYLAGELAKKKSGAPK